MYQPQAESCWLRVQKELGHSLGGTGRDDVKWEQVEGGDGGDGAGAAEGTGWVGRQKGPWDPVPSGGPGPA
jgi:hypothetical protein